MLPFNTLIMRHLENKLGCYRRDSAHLHCGTKYFHNAPLFRRSIKDFPSINKISKQNLADLICGNSFPKMAKWGKIFS